MDRVFPRILAIDPGTKCGYAYTDIARPFMQPGLKSLRHQAGLWDLSRDRFQSQGMRFLRFEKNMMEVEPDLVIYEEVNFVHKSTAAAQMYHGCVAVLQTFCEHHGLEYASVKVSDLKKRATGKGNSGKDLMISSANDFFEIDPPLVDNGKNGDDNIADAMWILQVGIEQYGEVVKRNYAVKKET